jgi:hypothetical protein
MKKLLVIICAASFVVSLNADVIVGFDLAGTTTDPLTANTVAANVTVNQGLARVDLVNSSSANAFGSNGWNISNTFNTDTDYISFSLTAASGYQLNLTDISWTRLNASNTAPNNGAWGYRIGTGSWVVQSPAFAITLANASGAWNFDDISGVTDTVEFRFWAYGATAVNGGTSQAGGGVTFRNSVVGDDLVLNGTVTVVPEPGVLSLLSLGAIAALRFSRRRKE